jgi:hypothetical protein
MTATTADSASKKAQGRLGVWLTAGVLAAVSMITDARAVPVAYTDQAAFLSALSGLGYAPAHEGFEDDAVWGGVRTSISDPNTSAAIANQGVEWTSNFSAGQITTSSGAARSGDWGFYSSPHGNYDPPSGCTDPGVCGDGIQGSAVSGVLYAIGGWFRTNTPYAELGMFVGSYPDNPVDFGKTCTSEEDCTSNSALGTLYKFFGIIDIAGFTAFEFRELEGTGDDQKLILSDDFYFAGSDINAPSVPAPAALPLLLSALALVGMAGWRRKRAAAS